MKKKILAALTLAAVLTLTACSQENLPYEIPVADVNTTTQEIITQTEGDASESPAETSTAVPAVSESSKGETEPVTDAEPVTDTEPVTETEATVTTPTVTEAPKWTETNIPATVMYINSKNVYSRVDAIQGSSKVEALGYNQAVTVIAKTDTGYFKTDSGNYVHQSFLSSEKTVTTTAAATTTTTTTTAATTPAATTPAETSSQIIGNYNQRAQTQAEIDFADKVFELTNAEREKAGLPKLKKSDAVTQMANTRAWELTVSTTHKRPDGSDFSTVLNGMDFLSIGENLAAGQVTPEDVVKAWMDSPHHKANILSTDFEYLGIGYYYVSGTTYKHYWIQTFYK